jgi:hypothetical protein
MDGRASTLGVMARHITVLPNTFLVDPSLVLRFSGPG